jgi:PemK-like, MazF-like toxin of type II toxin-antitoxin system
LVSTYSPEADGLPDPGEVVWTWVPYEDDPAQGKDRPVVVLSRTSDGHLLGLQLTSQDHDVDAEQEASWGRHWMDVGTGAWDPEGRPSEVRLDRLLRLPEAEVRREGAALDRSTFEDVVVAAREFHPDL